MSCAECEALAAEASIAEEESAKIRDRIAAALERGSAPPELLTAQKRLERTHQKCLDALDRHRQSHFRLSNVSAIGTLPWMRGELS
jgi:hypothetical protein